MQTVNISEQEGLKVCDLKYRPTISQNKNFKSLTQTDNISEQLQY